MSRPAGSACRAKPQRTIGEGSLKPHWTGQPLIPRSKLLKGEANSEINKKRIFCIRQSPSATQETAAATIWSDLAWTEHMKRWVTYRNDSSLAACLILAKNRIGAGNFGADRTVSVVYASSWLERGIGLKAFRTDISEAPI